MAAALPAPKAAVLRALLDTRTHGAALRLIGEQGRALEGTLRNTANATIVRGGSAVNVIPSEIEVELDGRLLPGFGPDDLLAELRDIIGPDVELEVLRHDEGPADPDMTFFDDLAAVIRELDPEGVPIPMLLPAVTDARHLSPLGIQTYGFMPLSVPDDFPLATVAACGGRGIPGRPPLRRGGDFQSDRALPGMRALVLGGTRFLGRALVDAPLEQGHEPTLSTAGRRRRSSSPTSRSCAVTARRSLGARGARLGRGARRRRVYPGRGSALGRRAARPRRSLRLRLQRLRLRGPERAAGGGAAVAELSAGEEMDEGPEPYGARKAACERIVEEAFGDAALVVRPGLIVGPHDPTGRFTYWPHRVARGGRCSPRAHPTTPCSSSTSAISRGGWSGGREGRRRDVQRHGRADALRRPARRVPRVTGSDAASRG